MKRISPPAKRNAHGVLVYIPEKGRVGGRYYRTRYQYVKYKLIDPVKVLWSTDAEISFALSGHERRITMSDPFSVNYLRSLFATF